MPSADALSDLIAVVGSRHVLREADATASYRVDWTGRYGSDDATVVRPGSTAEVAAVVEWARRHHVPLVAQGGNTGLVGGSVPADDGATILSTRRLDTIGDLDAAAGHVTVGAGVTLTALATRLAGSGWRFAVDLGARDSATIGGMIATNAGGMRVFRLGSTRAQLLGLEYVDAGGAVASHLGGLLKDNTGYDLASLLCGSEGTLGVITAARVRLVPDPPHRTTALVGFGSAAAAHAAAWALRRSCPSLEVIEYVSGACLEIVAETFGLAPVISAPAALLVEAAAEADPTDDVAAAIAALADVPVAVAVASDAARRAALWRFRDDITVALAATGPVVKFDLSIPAGSLGTFRAAADAAVAALAPSARTWWFGHVCDDNLHLNVTGCTPDDAADLDAAVYPLVAEHDGSISAEHGIGRAKAGYLALSRSPAEVAQMRAIKHALDPDGLLNPGVLLA